MNKLKFAYLKYFYPTIPLHRTSWFSLLGQHNPKNPCPPSSWPTMLSSRHLPHPLLSPPCWLSSAGVKVLSYATVEARCNLLRLVHLHAPVQHAPRTTLTCNWPSTILGLCCEFPKKEMTVLDEVSVSSEIAIHKMELMCFIWDNTKVSHLVGAVLV